MKNGVSRVLNEQICCASGPSVLNVSNALEYKETDLALHDARSTLEQT